MTKVLITQSKLDTLAEVIGGKSNTNVPLTVDEMITAADSITGGGGITPTGNIDITSAGVTDVTNYATATVPQGQMYADYIRGYKTVSGIKKWYVQPFAAIESGDEFGTEGYIADHTTEYGVEITYNAVPSGTTVTPSTSSQTIGGLNYMMESAVTVNPIPSQYIIPSGTYTVDSSGTKDVTNYASISVPSAVPYTGFYNNHFYTENNQRKWSITSFTDVDVSEGDIEGWLPDGFRETSDYVVNAVPSNTTITPSTSAQTIGGANYMMEGAVTVSAMPTGTAGTPTATKGAVNNHAISVTPSVTNTTGYITGSTKTGTAVSVSASELVSGTLSLTQNGTADVTNYASVDVSVSGGTSKNVQVVQGTTRTTSSSLTAIGAEMTVSKTGTYNVYWSAFRSNTSSQYTFATKLYINGTGYGSEQTTWSNHQQNVHLSNVSLSVNDKIRVYGRESRGSSYYMYAGTLTIVEA